MGQSGVSAPTITTLYIVAGAVIVATLAVTAPKIGVPLLVLVALIMLVRANKKAGG
jgi:1,4-dihydroxy-2-naphthoate octaprenyltransferase